MNGITWMSHKNGIPLFSVVPVALALVILASTSSALFQLPPVLLLFEIMLFLSLFVPGYLVQFVITSKLTRITLSKGERIACSFGLSIFLISSVSFITTLTGTGLREIFYGYFITSLVMFVIVLLINRSWILHGISSVFKTPRVSWDNLILFSLLFLVIPLFHLYGFAKLNWDGFTFYLRDALAISISNSISSSYPESFYPGNIPLVFNSYLSSVMYSYGLNVLNVSDFVGSTPALMEYANVGLSFVVLATLLATCLLLKSFAHRVFKDKYLVAATVIIFLTTPLLNQFLYVWSLYADLFFAFETLLVFVFAYRYLQREYRDSRYFSLLMIATGLSLAIATKTYGYVLLLVIPLICLRELRDRNYQVFSKSQEKNSIFANNYLSKIIVFALLAVIIGFASLYTIRGIMLTGSPFGYTVQTFANYSENEVWANNILIASGIHESVENYPSQNQITALLLSYGLFPLLLIPLLIGILLDLRGMGIFALYIICYFVIFVAVLELRVDRHLFSIIALLAPIYVYGLNNLARYLGWKREGILYVTIMLSLLQIPLFDAIYTDFKVASIFPSMYYWYTDNNLLSVLAYSLLTFGIAIVLTHVILTITTKRNMQPYLLGGLFGTMLLVIIVSPVVNILARYETYGDYIHTSYENQHASYPLALQEFLKINGDAFGHKLLYLHGMGTEFLTMAHATYIKIDDFRMLANMKDVIEEKDPQRAHELLASKDIRYILYPSESNPHYRKITALSEVTDNALIFSDPSSITTNKISLNNWWDLYIV